MLSQNQAPSLSQDDLLTKPQRSCQPAASASGHYCYESGIALTAFRLSKRETEVIAMLARGMTNREIAQVLFLSPETIKTYITRLLRKLGARNRTEAVSKAMAAPEGEGLL